MSEKAEQITAAKEAAGNPATTAPVTEAPKTTSELIADLEANLARQKAELDKSVAEQKAAIMESVIADYRKPLLKALADFVFEDGKVITIWKDGEGCHVKYGSMITVRASKPNGNGKPGNGNAKALSVPQDVQDAWGCDAEYQSRQSFFRFFTGDDGSMEAHARRDAFHAMKKAGATEGGMSLAVAWAKVQAHNLGN